VWVFRLTSIELTVLIFGIVLGATALGVFLGHRVRHLSSDLKEPFGVLQAALLGVVGLILAFGLSLAVTRYEDRRASVVEEANATGTTYLRAQTLQEPARSKSLALLVRYTERAVQLSDTVPGSNGAQAAADQEEILQRRLWALGGQAIDAEPVASAPRLYIETLNEMIDSRVLPGDSRAWRGGGRTGSAAGLVFAACDRRPRSADPGNDSGARHPSPRST
jgi:hypothetical protein